MTDSITLTQPGILTQASGLSWLVPYQICTRDSFLSNFTIQKKTTGRILKVKLCWASLTTMPGTIGVRGHQETDCLKLPIPLLDFCALVPKGKIMGGLVSLAPLV